MLTGQGDDIIISGDRRRQCSSAREDATRGVWDSASSCELFRGGAASKWSPELVR
jgi:hypothetical protein